MHVTCFPAQTTYPGGQQMCSSASTAMCALMTLLPADRALPDTTVLDAIMRNAAQVHACIRRHGEHLLTVADVIRRTNLAQWMQSRNAHSRYREVGGLVHGTPTDMRTDHCMDLGDLLQQLSDNACCTLTCHAHTVSVGRRRRQWWLCDSLPGEFVCCDNLQALQARLRCIMPSALEYSAVVF